MNGSEIWALRKAEQDVLGGREMRMLRWMMGIKRIEKIRTEEIRARAGVTNICKKIREARRRWLGCVERKTEKDVVMRTWKMEVRGHRNTKTDVERCYTERHEDISTERRSTRPKKMENENLMRRPQIGKRPKIFATKNN